MKKTPFWLFFLIFLGTALLVFIALISTLFKQDTIIYTDIPEQNMPTITKTDPVYGTSSPSVLIVYYGDFQCEYCAQTSTILKQVASEYKEDVTIVWKDFPNTSLHEEAVNAAVAARCAQKQNSFWPYYDMLMTNQRILEKQTYQEIAQQLNLRMWQFKMCVKRPKIKELVNASYEEGISLEITTAPTLFINGKRYTGVLRENDLRQLIEQILAQ